MACIPMRGAFLFGLWSLVPEIQPEIPPPSAPASLAEIEEIASSIRDDGRPGAPATAAVLPDAGARRMLLHLVARERQSHASGALAERLCARRDAYRKAGAEPALAGVWARCDVVPRYTNQVRQTARALVDVGDTCLAAGEAADAALAFAAAVAVLNDYAATSTCGDLVLMAAEELPKGYRGLARAAIAAGHAEAAVPLRQEADQWDRLYAEWRTIAQGPPNMLPRTGDAVFEPAMHRAAMLSLARVGVVFAAEILYWLALAIAAVVCAVALVFRRPSPPILWAFNRRAWASWVVAAAIVLSPTLAALGALQVAGDDWGWLFSVKLIAAVVILIVLAHGTALWIATRFLIRLEDERTRPTVEIVVPALTALAIASMLMALLLRSRPTTAPLLTAIELFAWCWLGVVALCVFAAYVRRAVRWLWRISISGATPSPGPGPRGSMFGRRRRATLTMTALGLFVHALLLPTVLRHHAQEFTAHSRAFATAFQNEAVHRLGADWQTRYANHAAELIAMAASTFNLKQVDSRRSNL